MAQERARRINGEIRVPEVRLTGLDGEMIGIVRTSQALAMAEEADVDLVEVSHTNTHPPLSRLMDYGKFRYQEAEEGTGTEGQAEGHSGQGRSEVPIRRRDKNDVRHETSCFDSFFGRDGNQAKGHTALQRP